MVIAQHSPVIQNPEEAEAYLAAIITSSDDAIISKDLNGNITSWNPAAERIFGYPATEAVGKHVSLIIPADRLPEEDYILGEVRNGRRVHHFETVRRAKDGHSVNISVTVSPIKNRQGQIIGASKVARDVTELKAVERTKNHLSAIVTSSDDAIISKDLNGIVTSWNLSAERIFGYSAEEMIGRSITTIIPSERLEEESKILTTLKTGERIDHFETVRRHKDGHLIPVSLTVSPIHDSSGAIVGASKISRDISERIKAETDLQEMSVKKDEFLANISHELRTPMNAVIGLANLLKTSPSLPERDRKFVDTLKLSADNLMDLINDLLDFSKIESGSIQIEKAELDLMEQVEKIISVMNVKALEKGIALKARYASSLNRYYLGDALRIHQVLTNLISNAIKFTEQGSVSLEIDSVPGQEKDTTLLTFKVSDTGIGIEKDQLSNIFEKFIQADASISRRYGGSGLGLAITKALVEKMNGTIEVESTPGLGTVFMVQLPLENSERQPTARLAEKASLVLAPVRKNVLLVEDYEPNVLVASTMLEQLGYDYDIAFTGQEALRAFLNGKFDVILMDVQMPGLDGLEVTRRIRQLEIEKKLPPTPIIAMTAHVREQDKDKCLAAGMDDFLPKPFDPAELSRKIATYVTCQPDSATGV